MTDLTALDALIKAVEAGDVFIGVKAARVFGDAACAQFASNAHRGSLDAAKALHDALLPGYTRDVDATAPECGIRVSIWSPSGPIVGVGDTEVEARAWLLAILRAYRYQIGGAA